MLPGVIDLIARDYDRIPSALGAFRFKVDPLGIPRMGKGGSESEQGGTLMYEDAPVNTGAVVWPRRSMGSGNGTEDADQTALLGGWGIRSPV
jgi:hypothetical protein